MFAQIFKRQILGFSIFIFWVFLPLVCAADIPVRLPSSITIATFNIRVFSDRSRDDVELRDIAQKIANFDIVAIQESRDILVLERLVRILGIDFGVNYSFSNSVPLGRGSRELYVFLWRSDRINPLSPIQVYPDPVDSFSREPAWQYFRVVSQQARPEESGFDFVLLDFHAIFGNKEIQRQEEARNLPTVVTYIQAELATQMTLTNEHDLLLLGDFNLSCQDKAFAELRSLGMEPINPGMGTTIKDSPYDNIWYFPAATREFLHDWGMIKFDETEFDGNDILASQAVSDHRPVWARFAAGPDDD